jgi:hypothetical protein
MMLIASIESEKIAENSDFIAVVQCSVNAMLQS